MRGFRPLFTPVATCAQSTDARHLPLRAPYAEDRGCVVLATPTPRCSIVTTNRFGPIGYLERIITPGKSGSAGSNDRETGDHRASSKGRTSRRGSTSQVQQALQRGLFHFVSAHAEVFAALAKSAIWPATKRLAPIHSLTVYDIIR